MTNCIKCHRELTDPVSISLGMGPICRKVEQATSEGDDHIWQYWPLGPLFGPTGHVILQKTARKCGGNIPWVLSFHSPSGLNWGYQGSGPADLALNILYAVLVNYGWREDHRTKVYHAGTVDRPYLILPTVWDLHQDFKRDFLNANAARLEIPMAAIIAWVNKTLILVNGNTAIKFTNHMQQHGFNFATGTWDTPTPALSSPA